LKGVFDFFYFLIFPRNFSSFCQRNVYLSECLIIDLHCSVLHGQFSQVPGTMKVILQEEAVSPVIGVILMVAITVILAAVIAAFVFGVADEIRDTKVVAAIAYQPTADRIIVTYQGGQDAQTCTGVHWTITNAAGSVIADTWMGTNTGTTALTVGTARTLPGTSLKDHVVAVAHFSEGFDQVVLDNSV
jgi:archaeal type IV pilus assembly protein PilA